MSGDFLENSGIDESWHNRMHYQGPSAWDVLEFRWSAQLQLLAPDVWDLMVIETATVRAEAVEMFDRIREQSGEIANLKRSNEQIRTELVRCSARAENAKTENSEFRAKVEQLKLLRHADQSQTAVFLEALQRVGATLLAADKSAGVSIESLLTKDELSVYELLTAEFDDDEETEEEEAKL